MEFLISLNLSENETNYFLFKNIQSWTFVNYYYFFNKFGQHRQQTLLPYHATHRVGTSEWPQLFVFHFTHSLVLRPHSVFDGFRLQWNKCPHTIPLSVGCVVKSLPITVQNRLECI